MGLLCETIGFVPVLARGRGLGRLIESAMNGEPGAIIALVVVGGLAIGIAIWRSNNE